MGIVIGKDTRRISFDNTFEINSPLVIEKHIEEKNTFEIDNLENEYTNEPIIEESTKYNDVFDDDHKYWSGRIESLRNEHQMITKIIETEYEKTIENANKLYDQPKIADDQSNKIKPCYTWRAKMLQCYENNPRETLVCSPVVQAFNQYIESCRIDE